jgi:hypothetical protein
VQRILAQQAQDVEQAVEQACMMDVHHCADMEQICCLFGGDRWRVITKNPLVTVTQINGYTRRILREVLCDDEIRAACRQNH